MRGWSFFTQDFSMYYLSNLQSLFTEALVSEGRQFDAVMALEVVEHVADPLGFCRSLGQLCRTGGGVFMSTINRTPRAYALAIGAAEYVLRWVSDLC